MVVKKTTPICPKCGKLAKSIMTEHGISHNCCGLRSWGYKELVSNEILEARKTFHIIFDVIWKDKGNKFRSYTYKYLSFLTDINEIDCHAQNQTDLNKLNILIEKSKEITTQDIINFIDKENIHNGS